MSLLFNRRYLILWTLIVCLAIIPGVSFSQHLGDPFLYQGLTNENSVGVKAASYGEAFTSRSMDLNSLFFNPAGLADIKSPMFSISGSSSNQMWRENQEWYPGSDYPNVNLMLDGLFTPDPAHNGIWSDSLIYTYYDKNGDPIGASWDVSQWEEPVTGKGKYSKENAEHEYTTKDIGFDQISAAVPFKLAGKSIVVAASFMRNYHVSDYDWNGTLLDPPSTTSDIIKAESGDTVRTNWSVFTRERTGDLFSVNAAVAVELSRHIMLGLGLDRFSGETTDELGKERVGYILTEHQEENWAFSYDDHMYTQNGTSKFSAFSVNVGGLLRFDHFNAGIKVKLPSTIQREWKYTIASTGQQNTRLSGIDEIEIPAEINFGVSIFPYEKLAFSFDFEQKAYSNAKYNLADTYPDTLTQYTKWVDQTAYKFGLEFKLFPTLSILGGYQSRTTEFVTYGAAYRDRGTPSETFSGGISYQSPIGRIDLAYLYYKLKYYDAFFGNVNYTLETTQRIMFGYTIEL